MYKSGLMLLCTSLICLGATTDVFAQSVSISGHGVRVEVGNRTYSRGGGYYSNPYYYRGSYPYSGTQVIIRTGNDDCYDSDDYYHRDRYYQQTNDYYRNTNYPNPYYQRYRGYYYP